MSGKIEPDPNYEIMIFFSIVLMTLTGHGRVALHQAQELAQHLTTPLEQQRDTTCTLRPHFQEDRVTRHNF